MFYGFQESSAYDSMNGMKAIDTIHSISLSSMSLPSSNDSDDGPHSFQCPITLELMSDPVILVGDGISYEREAIEQWLQSKDTQTSPATAVMLASGESRRLIPNVSLRNAIEEWKESQNL